MRRRIFAGLVLSWLVLGWAVEALAGMPTIGLTDVTRMRVQTLSFFLLVLLTCAWAIQGIWNGLRGEFPRLPRLSYGKAAGVVALWGLLFLLVLTMISGARELLTPGAWAKQGLTYRLVEAPSPPPEPDPDPARVRKLEGLRDALWSFAWAHDGRFPAGVEVDQLPDDAWRVPDPSGMRYLYVEGRAPNEGAVPLAYEPELFGKQRLVLLTDGAIRPMALEAIRDALPGEDR